MGGLAGTRRRAAAGAGALVLLLGGCAQVRDLVAGPTDADLLQAVSLTEQDAAPDAAFQVYPNGQSTSGTSLDLCYAEFPSEGLRTGRNQVAIGDAANTVWVSSEAILYATPAQAQQAMGELERAEQECPDEPVAPRDGTGDPVTWSFQAAPDADWPQHAGITRQAYAFTTTDAEGREDAGTATYLQRGRMILALYTTPAEAPSVAVVNAPDPARFAEVMTNRLSGLDAQALQRSNGRGTLPQDEGGFEA
ncbi:MAG TPA: hypothetical protein VF143_00475 [Candidatus Nanopelagicales bacterium]